VKCKRRRRRRQMLREKGAEEEAVGRQVKHLVIYVCLYK